MFLCQEVDPRGWKPTFCHLEPTQSQVNLDLRLYLQD